MPTPGRWLETMTWAEAEPVLKASPVVVLPLGARLKEHGLHLPLNNDWILAEYLTARIMELLSVVVVPTIPFHFYPAFVEYPGSVHLPLDTSRDLIVAICRSLAAHGPRRFYVLNTGVSTNRALEPARTLLAEDHILMRYTNLLEAMGDVEAALAQQEGGTHADEMETSMMLYIAPHIVHLDRARLDYHPSLGPGPLTRDPKATTGVYSPTGAWGDPTLATADKGRQLVDALVSAMVADIQALETA